MKKIVLASLLAVFVSSVNAAVVYECQDSKYNTFVLVFKKDGNTLSSPSTIGLNDWTRGKGKVLYYVQPDMEGSYTLEKSKKGFLWKGVYGDVEGKCKLIK